MQYRDDASAMHHTETATSSATDASSSGFEALNTFFAGLSVLIAGLALVIGLLQLRWYRRHHVSSGVAGVIELEAGLPQVVILFH